MDRFPGNEHLIELLKAVFVCAGGDNVISEEERTFFFGYLDSVGLPESLHEFVKTYDGKDSLEELLSTSSAINEATKRVILYTAMLVAGADGFADAEREAVLRAGKILGVSDDVVLQIEAQYRKDVQNTADRVALLFPEGNPWAAK